MAEDGTTASQSPPTHHRRSSFAGQTFADLFGTGRSSVPRPSNDGSNNSPPGQYAGPISQAAAKAQQRRLSLTTLGLSGAPSGTSPYNTYRTRQDSISSANSGSIDESAIEDDVGGPATARDPNSSMPGTPFARRMSFGARALRDVSGSGGGGGGGGSPRQNGTRSPAASAASKTPPNTLNSNNNKQAGAISSRTAVDAKGRGEGFNWSDNFRTRAERTASITGGGQGGMLGSTSGPDLSGNHVRAKSVAVMEPPVREMPKEQKRPDHFQERILKGDFYMD